MELIKTVDVRPVTAQAWVTYKHADGQLNGKRRTWVDANGKAAIEAGIVIDYLILANNRAGINRRELPWVRVSVVFINSDGSVVTGRWMDYNYNAAMAIITRAIKTGNWERLTLTHKNAEEAI